MAVRLRGGSPGRARAAPAGRGIRAGLDRGGAVGLPPVRRRARELLDGVLRGGLGLAPLLVAERALLHARAVPRAARRRRAAPRAVRRLAAAHGARARLADALGAHAPERGLPDRAVARRALDRALVRVGPARGRRVARLEPLQRGRAGGADARLGLGPARVVPL